MRERIAQLNGVIEISSAEKRTFVRATVPLPVETRAKLSEALPRFSAVSLDAILICIERDSRPHFLSA